MIPPPPRRFETRQTKSTTFCKSTAKETHAHAQQWPSEQHKRARGTCKKCSKKIGDGVYGAGGRYIRCRYILQTAQLLKEQKKCTKLVMDLVKTVFKSSLQGLLTLKKDLKKYYIWKTLAKLVFNLLKCIDFWLQKPDFKETKSIHPYSSNHVSMQCTFYRSLN